MSGLKTGESFLQIGIGNGRVLAALAARVGLSGRACAVDESADAVARGQTAAEKAGVLVEFERAPYRTLPYDDGLFDLVVVHDLLAQMSPEARVGALQEVYRVLRAGGRCLVMEPAPRGGLGALFGRRDVNPTYARTGAEQSLLAEGFKGARRLAEREGFSFIEAAKPRAPSA